MFSFLCFVLHVLCHCQCVIDSCIHSDCAFVTFLIKITQERARGRRLYVRRGILIAWKSQYPGSLRLSQAGVSLEGGDPPFCTRGSERGVTL